MLTGRTAQGMAGQGQNPLPRAPPPAASAELGTARGIPGQPHSDSSSGSTRAMGKVPGESGKRTRGVLPGWLRPRRARCHPIVWGTQALPEPVTHRGMFHSETCAFCWGCTRQMQHRGISLTPARAAPWLCAPRGHAGAGAMTSAQERGHAWTGPGAHFGTRLLPLPRTPVLRACTAGFPGEGSAAGLLEIPGDLAICPEPRAGRTRAQVTVGSHSPRQLLSSGMGLEDALERWMVAVWGCNTTTDQFKRPYW